MSNNCEESDNYNTWKLAGCDENDNNLYEKFKKFIGVVKKNLNKCKNSKSIIEFINSNCLENENKTGIFNLLRSPLKNMDDKQEEETVNERITHLTFLTNLQMRLQEAGCKEEDHCFEKKCKQSNGKFWCYLNKKSKNICTIDGNIGGLYAKKKKKEGSKWSYQPCKNKGKITENFKVSSSIDINLNILILSIIFVCGIFFFYKSYKITIK